MNPLLQIDRLTVGFPDSGNDNPVLENFSMRLGRGEMLAVVGESGSGKTVMSLALMRLLSNTARILSGSVKFSSDGRDSVELLDMPEKIFRTYRGSRLAMIFQEPMTSLNPVKTCGAQLIETLILHKKLNHSEAKKQAMALIKKVQLPEPGHTYRKYPHELSGGQKQRIMIAMAISCNPSILICDEPTTALDVRVQRTILDLLKELRLAENIGMIFITHDLGLVADMADRALVMLKGKVVEEGEVKDLFSNPKHPYTKGLLLCRPVLHKKGERLPVVADFLINEPVTAKVRQSNSDAHYKISTDILVKVRDLSLRYAVQSNWFGKKSNWTNAIKDVQFDIYRGETLGLVGESGSGKTTVGRALLGLNKPHEGSVMYGDQDILRMEKKSLQEFRRSIQIVFQDPYSSLNPRLMIGHAIAEPLLVHESLTRRERNIRVLELLEKVDLKQEHFGRYPHAFSGGQRQRIVIARALVLNPGFIVFDESVSALDVSVQAQVLNLIKDLKEQLGFTALFISHDLSIVKYLCDRVIVMEKGSIVEIGDVESVFQNPKSDYTRSLIEAIPGKKLMG